MICRPTYAAIMCLIIAGLISCGKNDASTTKERRNNSVISINDTLETSPRAEFQVIHEHDAIEGPGVLVMGEKFKLGDTVRILDDRKKPLSELVIIDEYQVLDLKCLKIDSLYYQIRWEGGKAYVAKSPGKIQFKTWEEHIVSICCVDFLETINPVKTQPNENSEILSKENDVLFHPIEIKGNWLQVSWGYKEFEKRGWIKWRDDKLLLIDLFYFA